MRIVLGIKDAEEIELIMDSGRVSLKLMRRHYNSQKVLVKR